ncbi:MAG: alpha/beta hydrolase family protein [Actinomycetes bacterium]
MSARNRRRMTVTPLRRRLAAAAGILALAVVAASCAAVPVQSLVRGAVAEAAPAAVTSTGPVSDRQLRPLPISPLAARAGEAAYAYPTSDGHEVRIHVVLATGPAPRPAVLILPGSEGFRESYLDLARTMAATGVDVVVGCWARWDYPSNSPATQCAHAQPRTAVVESTVPTIQALVDATIAATGDSIASLRVLGYSRGAGVAVLWAARTGSAVPIVDLAGMVTGQVRPVFGAGAAPDELNVVDLAATLPGPVLVIHSRGDQMVVPAQSDALVAARHAAGRDVTEHWLSAQCGGLPCNHNVLAFATSTEEVLDTTTAWLATLA